MAGAMDSRSTTNHAGVPLVNTATFRSADGAATVVVTDPADGRKIKLHGYALTMGTAGRSQLISSGGTSLTGVLITDGAPLVESRDSGVIGTCVGGENLSVSGDGEVAGNVSYSLV